MKPFDDPTYAPPADLSAEEFREYELAVSGAMRHAVLGKDHGLWVFDEIELQGSRPETVVVFRYRRKSRPDRLLETKAPIWPDVTEEGPEDNRRLDPAYALASWLWSSFEAGEYEARDCTAERSG